MIFKFTLILLSAILPASIIAQNVNLVHKADLPTPTLDEISGIIHWNGKLYGIEDSGNDPVIFEIDSTDGHITKTITLDGITNHDWEDLTQDDNYIYIGDFGNNIDGSRKDLKFYKVPKQSISSVTGSSGTVAQSDIQIINFSYPDQTTFCPDDFPCTSNNTQFDCEAVIYDNGKLHLFTKNWVTSNTVHYTIPVTAGTYTATKLDNLATDGVLITGATKLNENIVALLGYNPPGINERGWIWLITGFTSMDNLFTTATKKQKLDLGTILYTGQIEGIAAVKQTRVLITNERISSPFIIKAKLVGADLQEYITNDLLPAGITNFATHLSDKTVNLSWEYNEPDAGYFEIQVSASGNNDDFTSIGKINIANTYPAVYRFTDKSSNGFSGVKYYRIKIVTLNNQVFYSKIIPVRKNNGNAFNLLAAPSPFKDKLVISFYSDIKQVVQLSITDIYGRKIQNHLLQCLPGKYNYSIDGLAGLSSGVYIITARTKENLFVRKVLKQ